MGKLSRALSGTLVVAALVAACSDPLTVDNYNNPDRARVLARPSDVETLIKGTFRSIFVGTYGSDGLGPAGRTMAWENASNLNNWGLGPRSAIPRVFIDNNRGNAFLAENQTDWNGISRGLRAAGDGLYMMRTLSLGTPQADARAKAFGWFSLALGMGYLSMDYDSAVIVTPYEEISVIPDLSAYTDVTLAALAALDSAATWTTTARNVAGGYGTGNMFDNTWINGMTYTADQFTQLIKSYKAYFRANVARTPTERAAVDWARVRDDAAAGITATQTVTTTGGAGWVVAGNQWWLYAQWHQAHQLLVGMADSTCVDVNGLVVSCGASGATRQYDNWLAAPLANKIQFLIRTPDLRFPSGNTRTAQSSFASQTVPTGRLYFRNRSTADPDAAPWSSYYDWYRMLPWYSGGRTTAYPFFPVAMNDLLRAEALIRLGDVAGAAALIDRTRTTTGLPALAGVVTTATQPVPGGDACVPHVPQAPTYVTTACGNIMEAMKWEYRMETMFVSYISQWYSSRGWGDLPEGTPIHWPVPYQEMDTRRHPFYNLGGVGNPGGSVGRGNYGY